MIHPPASDSKIEAIIGMLARESSESAQFESGCGTPEQSSTGEKKADNLVSPWRKRYCQ